MIELILGGARSGKSLHAEQLAQRSGLEVHYIATATAWDDEMRARIKAHQQRRPDHFILHEAPLALAETLQEQAREDRFLLVDCLTLWLTNQLLESPDALDETCQVLIDSLARLPGRIVLVSNEVGMGVVPTDALSRRFVDESGRLHQAIAQVADQVWWVVAGLPQCLKSARAGTEVTDGAS